MSASDGSGTAVVEPGAAVSFEDDRVSVAAGARQTRVKRARSLALRLVGPALIVLIWYLVGVGNPTTLVTISSPQAVARELGHLSADGQLWSALAISLRRAALGLLLGVSVGTALGVIAGTWRAGELLVDSSMRMFQAIPWPAILPLFILWFGISEQPKIFFIAVATAFPMYINTYAGIRNVDRGLVEAGRVFGLNGVGIIRDVVFPGALPSILVGLRYALIYSVMALVIAEEIASSNGIGYLLTEAQQYLQTSQIMAAIVLYALLGIAADVLVRVLERVLLPWNRSFAGA